MKKQILKIVVLIYFMAMCVSSCQNNSNSDYETKVVENSMAKEKSIGDYDTNGSAKQETKSNVAENIVDEDYPITAYIEDKDGYTNVRSSPSVKSSILTTVKDGEIFYTQLSNPNSFWQVKTKDGTKGFMHDSRIRSDDMAYMKYQQTLYKIERREKEKKVNSTDNDILSLVNDLKSLIGNNSGKSKTSTCQWCGTNYNTDDGWFKNGGFANGEIGCIRYNQYQVTGYSSYCSKKCCSSD